jgi:DNA-binding response OmpR family regulator
MAEANNHRTVLLVDGNKRITRLLKINLENSGYNVSIACSVKEAEELAEKLKPSIVALASPLALERREAATRLREILGCPVVIYGVGVYESEDMCNLSCDGYIDRFYEPQEFLKHINALAKKE